MGNFNRGNRENRGGDRKFGRRPFGGDRGGHRGFGGRRDSDREMHKAVCSSCGISCEVPFKPTGDKPVFCNDCFKNKRSADPQGFRDGRNNNFGDRKQKPSFNNKGYEKRDDEKENQNYKIQFEMLNAKLDKILETLNPITSKEVKKPAVNKLKKIKSAPKKKASTATAKKPAVKKAIAKKAVVKKATTKKKAAVKKTAPKKKK